MFLWMLPMTPRTSVTRISGSGLRVSCFTAARISSACASTADFSFPQLLLALLGGGGLRLPLMSLLESEDSFNRRGHQMISAKDWNTVAGKSSSSVVQPTPAPQTGCARLPCSLLAQSFSAHVELTGDFRGQAISREQGGWPSRVPSASRPCPSRRRRTAAPSMRCRSDFHQSLWQDASSPRKPRIAPPGSSYWSHVRTARRGHASSRCASAFTRAVNSPVNRAIGAEPVMISEASYWILCDDLARCKGQG